MSGLWRNNSETPEGKYPIVLRRDGSVVTTGYFVLLDHDPAFIDAMGAYADSHKRQGSDPKFVQEIYDWVNDVINDTNVGDITPGDPDAPPHRIDDPKVIAWARSVHSMSAYLVAACLTITILLLAASSTSAKHPDCKCVCPATEVVTASQGLTAVSSDASTATTATTFLSPSTGAMLAFREPRYGYVQGKGEPETFGRNLSIAAIATIAMALLIFIALCVTRRTAKVRSEVVGAFIFCAFLFAASSMNAQSTSDSIHWPTPTCVFASSDPNFKCQSERIITIITSQWWILAQANSGYTAEIAIPHALGPYPSQEMCRIAGNKMMPEDRRFWTDEARAKAEAKEKEESAKREVLALAEKDEIAALGASVRAGKIKPGEVKLLHGGSVWLDKEGHKIVVDGIGTFTVRMETRLTSTYYTALTPCVEIKATEASK